jgi:hypothetical protein
VSGASAGACYVRTLATIQQTVQAAAAFAQETLGADRTGGLQLEEIDSGKSNGDEVWLITLSMVIPPNFSINAAFDALSAKREYNVFSVLKNSGEVVSMRIRELAAT